MTLTESTSRNITPVWFMTFSDAPNKIDYYWVTALTPLVIF